MADFLHVVCITGMFHRHSVERKLMHHGTAVDVPRKCSTEPAIISALLRYRHGIAHSQAHDSNERLKRTHGITHGHMNSARMNSVHMNSTRTARGEGVATGDDDHTAIHKQARQKMPKGGKRGLASPTKNA